METRRAPDGVPWEIRGTIRPCVGAGLFPQTIWLSPRPECWRHVTAEGRLCRIKVPLNHWTTTADISVIPAYACLDLTSWEVCMMYPRCARLPVP
jgi:hypothetical protein